MRMPLRSAATLATLLVAFAIPAGAALAHHAFQAEFDHEAPVTLTGKISSVDYANPHSRIIVTVTEPGKPPQEWAVLTGTPGRISERGLCAETLKPGTPVIIHAFRSVEKDCASSRTGPNGAIWPVARGTCKAGGDSLEFEATKTVVDLYNGKPTTEGAPEPGICKGSSQGG